MITITSDSMFSLQSLFVRSLLSSAPTDADKELLSYRRFVACHDCGVVFSLQYASIVGFCPVCEPDSFIDSFSKLYPDKKVPIQKSKRGQ